MGPIQHVQSCLLIFCAFVHQYLKAAPYQAALQSGQGASCIRYHTTGWLFAASLLLAFASTMANGQMSRHLCFGTSGTQVLHRTQLLDMLNAGACVQADASPSPLSLTPPPHHPPPLLLSHATTRAVPSGCSSLKSLPQTQLCKMMMTEGEEARAVGWGVEVLR